MITLNSKERELVAIGAAIASNCTPCMEFHIPAAREAGLSDKQILFAIKIAEAVKKVPADAVRARSLDILDGKEADVCNDQSCMCHQGEDEGTKDDACDDPGCACNQDSSGDSPCCS
ncbi:MAG: carboxymuconolactone decarboxylase family protein [Candidatus Cloacimonetes bacterium]|nr:carboxymuconolactone decarboxylase family protein [Candidatus Cloacimonadota bacterium]MCK9334975.1 carboxymuconolactone decarboxylase family protein [Candidatus Cloacimonadota bacterium]MDD2544537.1 carboxymuconolactone decarboxylase family protein [Candidatus Cloacimonadota bacterium]MDD2683586.1 carboxymuconolactone decarboxylase family protein [Candidatus Cloacimonadota bacterium]MDD3097777.1 carboxymuconolactone decarboxylase family protein [Candidatus Cloacimonadota bacterium]